VYPKFVILSVGVAYNQGRGPKTAITATNREPRTQPKMLARLGKLFGIVSSSELMSFGWMCVCLCGCMCACACDSGCSCECVGVRWLVGIYHTARTGSLNVCFKLCRHQLSLSPHATVCLCVCAGLCVGVSASVFVCAWQVCALIASNSYKILIANVEITHWDKERAGDRLLRSECEKTPRKQTCLTSHALRKMKRNCNICKTLRDKRN